MNECFNGTDLETVDEEARGKSDGAACTNRCTQGNTGAGHYKTLTILSNLY